MSGEYNKDNPYISTVTINSKLNKEGSIKDTRHIEFDLGDSGISYEVGDALYICPKNEEGLVEDLLSQLDLSQDKESEIKRFTDDINITRASNKLYKLLESKIEGLEAKSLVEEFNGYSVAATLKTLRDKHAELRLSSDELAENSSKLMPRAYSIASSINAHPNEVHLCISRVDEEINGQKFLGVCSNYISDRVPVGSQEVGVYVHRNDKFRLPADASTDIIMVGPGTGIAPFRAFIEERNYQRSQGQKLGQDWLFFGDQRAAYDYLYDYELLEYEKQGLKITTAFSRDQEHKVYVQTRMSEHADELWDKLSNGAYFYVCGDARRMAKDVDTTLREIAAANGVEDVDAYMKELKDSGRYCRDVY